MFKCKKIPIAEFTRHYSTEEPAGSIWRDNAGPMALYVSVAAMHTDISFQMAGINALSAAAKHPSRQEPSCTRSGWRRGLHL